MHRHIPPKRAERLNQDRLCARTPLRQRWPPGLPLQRPISRTDFGARWPQWLKHWSPAKPAASCAALFWPSAMTSSPATLLRQRIGPIDTSSARSVTVSLMRVGICWRSCTRPARVCAPLVAAGCHTLANGPTPRSCRRGAEADIVRARAERGAA